MFRTEYWTGWQNSIDTWCDSSQEIEYPLYSAQSQGIAEYVINVWEIGWLSEQLRRLTHQTEDYVGWGEIKQCVWSRGL